MSEDEIKETEVEVLLEKQAPEESIDPPMDEWSSLLFEVHEENVKKRLYAEGLYSPGSGEVCAKYIAISDSDVYLHPLFKYPGIKDPGVLKALLEPEEKVVYAPDGQELYLALCMEMGQCPVRLFYRNIVMPEIDLSYYCVNPSGVRAMAHALKYNKIVKVLRFTENFLSDDACFHLGEMLSVNCTLVDLDLTGCRIGVKGVKCVCAGLVVNRALRRLNLNKNELTDEGGEIIAQAIFNGIDVQELGLSYNKLGSPTAKALTLAFETHNKLTHLDLSWNNLYVQVTTFYLLALIGESDKLQSLNLSWNSLEGEKIGLGIKSVIASPNLRHLNLSHNRLSGPTIDILMAQVKKAKKLETLDLSDNPLTASNALEALHAVEPRACKLKYLLMDNVIVDTKFMRKLAELRLEKPRVTVTHGDVTRDAAVDGPDARELVLERADYLMTKHKKHKLDIALLLMQLLKDKTEFLGAKDLMYILKVKGIAVDADLLDELVAVFPGPKTAKGKTMDLSLAVDYIHRKWPDRKLPPTPPPEPKPEPQPPKGKKGKGKK